MRFGSRCPRNITGRRFRRSFSVARRGRGGRGFGRFFSRCRGGHAFGERNQRSSVSFPQERSARPEPEWNIAQMRLGEDSANDCLSLSTVSSLGSFQARLRTVRFISCTRCRRGRAFEYSAAREMSQPWIFRNAAPFAKRFACGFVIRARRASWALMAALQASTALLRASAAMWEILELANGRESV